MKVDDFPGVDPEPDAALVAAKSAHSAMERLSPNVTSSSGATAIPSRGPAVTSQPGVVTQSDLSATTTQGNEAPTSTPSVATLSSNNAGGPKQKQPKAQKQKGKNAGNGDSHGVKQDGHHVWRGEELVTGWGDLTQPRHTTPSM
ncbi:hypothetical protein QFC19_005780 [Naganishia cerealis]|uniref:Uncharacterized protein n=1 Tax=Naganishia cerealis TaxID=610337 RepID=A0ACC2VLZ7_9TREE|nr:hypothetical protein QFC19_005780 [Naganishia cerealis]